MRKTSMMLVALAGVLALAVPASASAATARADTASAAAAQTHKPDDPYICLPAAKQPYTCIVTAGTAIPVIVSNARGTNFGENPQYVCNNNKSDRVTSNCPFTPGYGLNTDPNLENEEIATFNNGGNCLDGTTGVAEMQPCKSGDQYQWWVIGQTSGFQEYYFVNVGYSDHMHQHGGAPYDTPYGLSAKCGGNGCEVLLADIYTSGMDFWTLPLKQTPSATRR
jgi:hypothetical protein